MVPITSSEAVLILLLADMTSGEKIFAGLAALFVIFNFVFSFLPKRRALNASRPRPPRTRFGLIWRYAESDGLAFYALGGLFWTAFIAVVGVIMWWGWLGSVWDRQVVSGRVIEARGSGKRYVLVEYLHAGMRETAGFHIPEEERTPFVVGSEVPLLVSSGLPFAGYGVTRVGHDELYPPLLITMLVFLMTIAYLLVFVINYQNKIARRVKIILIGVHADGRITDFEASDDAQRIVYSFKGRKGTSVPLAEPYTRGRKVGSSIDVYVDPKDHSVAEPDVFDFRQGKKR